MDLRQILRTIRANLVVAVVVFVICLGAGVGGAVIPAKEYKASVVLLALPSKTSNDPASDVTSIQVVIPQLVVEAESPAVATAAKRLVPASYRNASVTITSTGDPGSNSLSVSASSADPHVAKAYADAVSAALIPLTKKQLASVVQLDQLGSALLPTKPSNPRTTVLVASFVFAVIAAIFAALAASGIRRRFRQVDEVRARVGMPVLAEVPRIRTGIMPVDIFWGRDAPEGLEAFQELRSSLLLMFPGTSPVFAVTSCSEGEGKSSVAANLAWALASESLRVIAVDCDLRKPTLNQLLGVEIEPGVSDHASGGVQSLIATTQNPYLEVIPAGIPDRHPADIVSSRVPQLLASLRHQGAGVVMDCPPLSGAAETMTLAVSSDAVVVVVDARRFNPEELQQSVARLEASGATVAGVVLNRVRKGTHTPYGYGSYGARPQVKGSKSENGSKARNEPAVDNGSKPEETWSSSMRNR